jgi:hypothetical protein
MTERIINCRKRNAASIAIRCTDPSYRTQENERNAQAMATRFTNPAYRMQNAQAMATSCTNPAYRRQEQIADTNHRRMTRQTNPPEIRAQENEKNAASMATSCTNPAYR